MDQRKPLGRFCQYKETCTTFYFLSLSVWAGRKPMNGRQHIFLITRMSCELSSLKRTGNKLIYSCTHTQIFCLLFKEPKRLVTGLLTHNILQIHQQYQHKILSRFLNLHVLLLHQMSHSNQSHCAFCLGYLQTSRRISIFLQILVNSQMATKVTESSMCSFAVTIPPFYFIAPAINKEYPESCTRLLSSCQSRERNCR